MNIYEQYGRLAEHNQQVIDTFATTLQLLRDLKAGKVKLEKVQVDKSGWRVADAGDGDANPSA